MQENEIQKLTLDGQKRLSMSGVESVDAFSEQQLRLTLSGNKVLIGGDGIKITAYNKSTGSLQADGKFTSIKYDVKKSPLLKRLFK